MALCMPSFALVTLEHEQKEVIWPLYLRNNDNIEYILRIVLGR